MAIIKIKISFKIVNDFCSSQTSFNDHPLPLIKRIYLSSIFGWVLPHSWKSKTLSLNGYNDKCLCVGLLRFEKPSPKAKLETERVQNLARYVRKTENKHTPLKLPSVFFLSLFFFHVQFSLVVEVLLLSSFPCTERPLCLGSLFYSPRHHNSIKVDSFPPTSPIYKNAIAIYVVRRKQCWHHWVLGLQIKATCRSELEGRF